MRKTEQHRLRQAGMTGFAMIRHLQEELESKYGCPMVELDEDELLEIVEQFVKLTPESAKWEENMQGIKYKYQEECA